MILSNLFNSYVQSNAYSANANRQIKDLSSNNPMLQRSQEVHPISPSKLVQRNHPGLMIFMIDFLEVIQKIQGEHEKSVTFALQRLSV